MDTNDWKKLLAENEQRIADEIERCRTSGETVLQLAASKIEPVFGEIQEILEKLLGPLDPPEGQ